MATFTFLVVLYTIGILWATFIVSLLNERRWWLSFIWPIMIFVFCFDGIEEKDYV